MNGCGATRSARGGNPRWLACAAVLGALLCGGLLWSAAADAALVHPFLGTVSKTKKGFSEEVCGVSADASGGEIAVSDPGTENVQVFAPTFEASGKVLASNPLHTISKVQIAEEETPEEAAEREAKEKAEVEKGKTPKEVAGKFSEKEELEEFCSTAFDDKNGDLYIADGGLHAIFPFDKEGKQVFATNKEGKKIAGAEITGKATPAGEFGEELSIAFDQKTGRLYVSDRENEVVDYFGEGGKYEGQLAFPAPAENEHRPGALAVDQSTGEVYVSVQGQAFDELRNEEFAFIYAFDSSGKFLREIGGHSSGSFAGFGFEAEPLVTGLAVGPEHNLYASDGLRRVVFEFSPSGSFLAQLGSTPSGSLTEPLAVATNAEGKVYVVDRTEEVNGVLEEQGLAGLPGQLDVFGPAENGGPPTIESESVSDLTATSATLNATIDPTGVATSYYFELCQDSACTKVPTPPGTAIGNGEAAQAVSQLVTGLTANTIYTYRVVATYAGGASSVLGAAQSFTTTTEGTNVELPDGRGWELVSSPEKDGAGLESIPREGGLIEAAANGSGLTYISLAALTSEGKGPEGNRVPSFVQLLAKRGASKWSNEDIALPGENATGAITGNGKQEYRDFTPDLELSLVEPLGLSPKAEPVFSDAASERTIYTRQTEGCQAPPSVCYTPLVNDHNIASGAKYGGSEGAKKGIEFVNATPDLSHVIVTAAAGVLLTPEAASQTTANLYEYSGGQLKLVNLLPEVNNVQKPAPGPELGGNHLYRNAISSDGSRVVFTATIEGNIDLFTRDTATGVTQQVDLTETGEEPASSNKGAVYQTASSDGTKIFFTQEAKLTALSSAGAGNFKSADLYEFDTETGKVTDLSVDPNFASAHERAEVLGLVPGASADGSTVYYVSNGVLTKTPNANGETAAPGRCVGDVIEASALPAGATCNLYVKHGSAEAEPTFIGRLSADDLPDFENNGKNGNLEYVTSRVSPNGQYYAFMSDRSLTGYDNRDASPAAHEARDEEVFLYNAANGGSLTCASCNPNGTRPTGVFDGGGQLRTEEGVGLIADRILAWEGKWLAAQLPGWTGSEGLTAIYQSRYLSDEGRLFFDSTDPLVTADANAKNDVYEYEPNGMGSCAAAAGCTGLISSGSSTHESTFLDASENGDDVFFLTASALSTSDHDNDFDVYDARVCGSAGCIVPNETTATSCNSTAECRPSTASTPSFSAPAGATTPSSGNLGPQTGGVLDNKVAVKPTIKAKKPTRAQLLARALKKCKKLKNKKKRAACQKQARKKYGAKKASKAKHASKGKK
jgi:hypothetical protein